MTALAAMSAAVISVLPVLLVLLVLPVSMTGCATSQQDGRRSSARIDAYRSGTFDGAVTRLVVLLGRSQHPDEDQLLLTSIEHELQTRRVSAVVAIVSGTTLDEPQPLQAAELADKRSAIRSLSPDAVMRIRATSVIANAPRPQSRAKIVYQIELHLTSAGTVGQRVWRAELEHSGPDRNMDKRFALAAACLMERLDAEGILASSN